MGDNYNADVEYDSAGLRKMAEDLEDLADYLDGADESIPQQLDAGVFAPLVADQINESVANVAKLILRLKAAAGLVRATADAREHTERENERDADDIDGGPKGVYAR